MVLRKITDQEYKKIITDLRNLGNPEITRIMAIYKEKVQKYKELLSRFVEIEESAWYLYKYDSSESSCSKKGGDKSWNFVKMLRIVDTGKDSDDYIHNDYHNPDFACLRFELTITIPYFTGSNLDIPEGKKIRYDYGSSWDLHLVPPLFNDRNGDQRTRSERLEFTTSLHAIDTMFDVNNQVKAYIIQKFEEYRRYYQILLQLA